MSLPLDTGADLIRRAVDETRRDRYYAQWCAYLPYMDSETYISFREYCDRRDGKNLDLRPTSELLAEQDEIEELFRKEENDGS